MATLQGRGIQRISLNLAAEMRRRGVDFELLVSRREGEFIGRLPEGLPVQVLSSAFPGRVSLPPGVYWPWLGSSGRYRLRLGALLDYVNTAQPDIVLSAGLQSNLMNALVRKRSRHRYRAVLSEHNHVSSKTVRARKRWKRDAIPALYPAADALLAVSQGVADDLARILRIDSGQVGVIPNPVVTDEFLAGLSDPPPHLWFTDGGPPVVLGVGHLRPRKNFPLLVRAVARVQKERPVRLMLLGEGPERAGLAALAETLGLGGALAMPGFVPNVAAYMRCASAFALTSHWEGFANVVAEALACGCPVVSVDCPSGPSEILAGGRFGRLVPQDDEKALAQAILRTLEASPDRTALKARGLDYAVAPIASRYLEFLEVVHRREWSDAMPGAV